MAVKKKSNRYKATSEAYDLLKKLPKDKRADYLINSMVILFMAEKFLEDHELKKEFKNYIMNNGEHNLQ